MVNIPKEKFTTKFSTALVASWRVGSQMKNMNQDCNAWINKGAADCYLSSIFRNQIPFQNEPVRGFCKISTVTDWSIKKFAYFVWRQWKLLTFNKFTQNFTLFFDSK